MHDWRNGYPHLSQNGAQHDTEDLHKALERLRDDEYVRRVYGDVNPLGKVELVLALALLAICIAMVAIAAS